VDFTTWLWVVEPLALPLLLAVMIVLLVVAAAARAGLFDG
jgi:hypothetical protein